MVLRGTIVEDSPAPRIRSQLVLKEHVGVRTTVVLSGLRLTS